MENRGAKSWFETVHSLYLAPAVVSLLTAVVVGFWLSKDNRPVDQHSNQDVTVPASASPVSPKQDGLAGRSVDGAVISADIYHIEQRIKADSAAFYKENAGKLFQVTGDVYSGIQLDNVAYNLWLEDAGSELRCSFERKHGIDQSSFFAHWATVQGELSQDEKGKPILSKCRLIGSGWTSGARLTAGVLLVVFSCVTAFVVTLVLFVGLMIWRTFFPRMTDVGNFVESEPPGPSP